MRALLVLLAACASEPPTIGGIEPKTGNPGDAITISGDHFTKGTTARLGGQPVEDLVVLGPDRITGKVPAALGPGEQALTLSSPSGKTTQVLHAFTVVAPSAELVLCQEGMAGYAKTMLQQETIQIARYKVGKEGKPDITELRFRDIEAVQYEGHARAGGTYCSAIILLLKDGRRVLFEDATDTNLKLKASNFSQTIGRPVELVNEDPLPEP